MGLGKSWKSNYNDRARGDFRGSSKSKRKDMHTKKGFLTELTNNL